MDSENDFLDLDQANNLDDLKSKIPLQEGVLKVNLGIPIIIVCTKTDLINHGDKVQQLQTNIDFIMKKLREYAL